MFIRTLIFFSVLLVESACVSHQYFSPTEKSLSKSQLELALESLKAESPSAPGFAIAVVENEEVSSAAIGVADPTGRPMTADTPVRIASITKTFVAAAILRLWEDGRVDLDDPIRGLISPEYDRLLRSDNYETDRMTIRHLLMHSSGLNDHSGTAAFEEAAFSDPTRKWSKADQIQILISETERMSEPGEAFHYSDTGYVLLGDVLERLTDLSLGQAVPRLNRLDEIGLENIRWEGDPDTRSRSPDRAHQYISGVDTFGINGSVDAFGGGGIIASVENVARYYSALFSGRIFRSKETLEHMLSAPGHPEDSPYRMGLFVRRIGDKEVFAHGGFWGTDVMVLRDSGIVISGVTLEQGAVGVLSETTFALAVFGITN